MKRKAKKVLSTLLMAILTVTLAPQSLLETVGVKSNVDAETVTLSNPRIVTDSSMTSGQKVTWDCVYFGSYPQTEIVDQESTSGCYGKKWATESDYEVNENLYAILQNDENFDAYGDTTINGTKYRRIKESDVTYGTSGYSNYYDWADSGTYHYFRYDPIKWRVLEVSGNQALLLADKALDDQKFDTSYTNTCLTWGICTIRSWLNGYESSANAVGTDYSSENFIDTAFSSSEQNAIVSTTVLNDIFDNTEDGKNTIDKIFLLSASDIYYEDDEDEDKDTVKSYGFTSSSNDEARKSKSTSFAKAMGTRAYTSTSYLGNCNWWLRTPAYNSTICFLAYYDGQFGNYSNHFYDSSNGCRPALNLNLSSNLYSFAGVVSSDGAVDEDAASGSVTHTHSWGTGEITKQPTCTESGVRTYTCSCGETKTEEISATGHVNTEISNAKPATCKEEGYTGDTYCKDCDTEISKGEVIQKLATHTYDDWTITKNATCTEDGVKTRTCSVCGASETGVVPATSHQNTDIRNAKEATCQEEGYSGDTYCKDCGIKISSGKVISKLTTHTYGAWNITQPATVFAEGSQTRTCSVCGNTETQSIPKLTPTIKLSKTKLTLKKKKTTTIKVSNLANGDSVKSWKSTKKKVAVVNSKGKIKAKKKGKTNIIVTLASGKTAVVKVTVK